MPRYLNYKSGSLYWRGIFGNKQPRRALSHNNPLRGLTLLQMRSAGAAPVTDTVCAVPVHCGESCARRSLRYQRRRMKKVSKLLEQMNPTLPASSSSTRVNVFGAPSSPSSVPQVKAT
jgi:hypothetical protein